ncbi:MAG: hypothetical protein QXD38_07695 [Ignisphaera sp.]
MLAIVLFIAMILVIGLAVFPLVHVSSNTVALTQTITRYSMIIIFSTFTEIVVITKTTAVKVQNGYASSMVITSAELHRDEGFGLCIAKMTNKVFPLLADTPELRYRGYRNKTDVDFMGVRAIGVIFLNWDSWVA